ncbi:hypothetical protein [Streptacidiphilus sp. EB129]|uniref:hypothetical protein n=1 Tax=Streptacidiphilus sp. EB129 TaxID=3156262 RepID=UPI0035115A5D
MPRSLPRTCAAAATAAVALIALGSLTGCGPTTSQSGSAAASAGPSGSPSLPASSTAQPGVSTSTTTDSPSPTSAAASPGPAGGRATGLPASVWMAARSIPLDPDYHWTAPAGIAQGVSNPTFAFERLCHATRDPSNDLSDWHGPAAQAQFGTGNSSGGDWQGQQTVIRFPGTSSAAAQLSWSLYQGLQQELNACGSSASGAKVKLTSSGTQDLAAVVTIPQPGGGTITLHQYLALTGTTVAELAVSSQHPSHSWSAPSDTSVLAALQLGLQS